MKSRWKGGPRINMRIPAIEKLPNSGFKLTHETIQDILDGNSSRFSKPLCLPEKISYSMTDINKRVVDAMMEKIDPNYVPVKVDEIDVDALERDVSEVLGDGSSLSLVGVRRTLRGSPFFNIGLGESHLARAIEDFAAVEGVTVDELHERMAYYLEKKNKGVKFIPPTMH